MGKFDDYWDRLVAANPGLGDFEQKISITVGAFRRQVEKAFTEGAKSSPVDDGGDDPMDEFLSIFGRPRGK